MLILGYDINPAPSELYKLARVWDGPITHTEEETALPGNVPAVLSMGPALMFEYSRAEHVILEVLSSPFAKRIPQRFQEVQQAVKIEEHVRPCSLQKA